MVCSMVTGAASCFDDVFCSMHEAYSMHECLESSGAEVAKTTMAAPALIAQKQGTIARRSMRFSCAKAARHSCSTAICRQMNHMQAPWQELPAHVSNTLAGTLLPAGQGSYSHAEGCNGGRTKSTATHHAKATNVLPRSGPVFT